MTYTNSQVCLSFLKSVQSQSASHELRSEGVIMKLAYRFKLPPLSRAL